MKPKEKRNPRRNKASNPIAKNKAKSSVHKVLKTGIKKTRTKTVNNLETWIETEIKSACNSVIYKNMSITEAADYFNIPFSKLCFYVRQERSLLSKKDLIDRASTQGNLNETDSEFEEIEEISNASVDDNKKVVGSISDVISDDISDEDEEVKKIMNDFNNSSSMPCTLSIARKSTSPFKVPSYLRSEFNGNKNVKNDTKQTKILNSRAKHADGSHFETESIEEIDFIAKSSSNTNGVQQTNGNGAMPSTVSVVSYIRDKKLDSSDFTHAMAKSKAQLLAEFEKPVKIYSYLSLRQKQHPLFLKRNLNYTHKTNRRSDLISSNEKKAHIFETLYKKIKSAPSLKPGLFDLKFTFESIELNNSSHLKNIQNTITTDALSDFACKISAFIEIYAIQTNSNPNLLARCQCPIKVPNERNRRVYGSLFESTEHEASVNFQLDPTQFSHVLIKLRLERSHALKDTDDHPKDVKPQAKRRKSNKSEPLENIHENGPLDGPNLLQQSNIIQENFIVCHLKTDIEHPSLNKTVDSSFLDVIQTESLFDLKLKNDSMYTLKMSEATDKDKEIFEQFNLNCNQTNENSNKRNVQKSERKSVKNVRKNFFTKNSVQTFCETVEDLLDQFYESKSLIIRFSTKLNEVIKSPVKFNSPVKCFSSLPKTPVLSMKMIFNSEKKQQNSRKTRSFHTIEPDLSNKKVLKTDIINPISKIADQPVIYQFNSTKSKNNNNVGNSKSTKSNSNSGLVKLLTQSKNFTCPFCYQTWKQVNCLYIHLQMCHFRFHTSEQHFGSLAQNGDSELKAKKLQFNIWCDDIYDGSYLGNPYDLQNSLHLGYSGCRLKPTKRSSVTYILVNKKSNFIDESHFENLNASEIEAIKLIQQQQQQQLVSMQPNNLYNVQAGMERLFYHTTTTLPIQVDEIENDSDNDLDPEWLKDHTTLLINDFNDVNEGEKGIMLLWNLHLLKNNYVADSQVFSACEQFIREKTKQMLQLKLTNNFLLHLANLHDYGMLTPNEILRLIDFMHEMKAETV